MSYTNKMVILKGQPKDDIESCYYDKETKKQIVTFKNGKTYKYEYSNVEVLDKPININKDDFQFTNKDGVEFSNIKNIIYFKGTSTSYFRFFFENGIIRSYKQEDLQIKKNALNDENAKQILNYYKSIANNIGLKTDEGNNILQMQFDKLTFVDENTVLSSYLSKKEVDKPKNVEKKTMIFPFGCNLSQVTAVNKAIDNKISIIEGPPGTGKTQTILNIIANILIRKQTVAIVSNNNSATNNVFEKLEKYNLSYIAAQLGSSQNKKDFINNKQVEYPDFSQDFISNEYRNKIVFEIEQTKNDLMKMFENQNRVALLKSELSAIETERAYFDEYFSSLYSNDNKQIFRKNTDINSKMVLKIWIELEQFLEKNKKVSLIFKIKSYMFYGINDLKLFNEETNSVIDLFKKQFYDVKISEIENEIKLLEQSLKSFNFSDKISQLTDESMWLLKDILANKYASEENRIVFDEKVFYQKPNEFITEYPVILSTTHAVTSSLKGITYDYVIVDEASQVDLATGVLAMSCAKNIVVVGDLKQLPNVIAEQDKLSITQISNMFNIPKMYRYEEQNLLSSICEVFPKAPKTLLKEHYRCHPKIINFCNQKFYKNQLVIMTKDNNEDDVLEVVMTTTGNHARGHYNQRQIDEIKFDILPRLNSTYVGIISPYTKQTEALNKNLTNDIDISTVHKFQGREKDDIIISTVDNEITDFTDNPNMLNVAVSRAKNRLVLVVSDNDKNNNTNIGDLIKYIKYNNFSIQQSEIFSVFDMLYKNYENARKEYLSKYKRISDYDSENLMYSVITDVLNDDLFSKLGVITHQKLKLIIRDTHKLTADEMQFAMNDSTHLDFIIYNKMDKSIVLAIEVDGYKYHENNPIQKERDIKKDKILEKYNIPLIRFSTTGSMEKERLREKLLSILT